MFGARCAPQPALFQCVTDVDIAGAFCLPCTPHPLPNLQCVTDAACVTMTKVDTAWCFNTTVFMPGKCLQ